MIVSSNFQALLLGQVVGISLKGINSGKKSKKVLDPPFPNLIFRIPIRPLTPASADFPSDSGWEK